MTSSLDCDSTTLRLGTTNDRTLPPYCEGISAELRAAIELALYGVQITPEVLENCKAGLKRNFDERGVVVFDGQSTVSNLRKAFKKDRTAGFKWDDIEALLTPQLLEKAAGMQRGGELVGLYKHIGKFAPCIIDGADVDGKRSPVLYVKDDNGKILTITDDIPGKQALLTHVNGRGAGFYSTFSGPMNVTGYQFLTFTNGFAMPSGPDYSRGDYNQKHGVWAVAELATGHPFVDGITVTSHCIGRDDMSKAVISSIPSVNYYSEMDPYSRGDNLGVVRIA